MILDIPVVRQRDGHTCGLAVFNAVRRYYGSRGVKELGLGVPCPIDGTDPRQLEMAFRGAGYAVQAGSMDRADLLHHARQWRPVVLLVQADGNGHYVVSAGLDRGRVALMDPLRGIVRERWPDFAPRWVGAGIELQAYRQFGIAVGVPT